MTVQAEGVGCGGWEVGDGGGGDGGGEPFRFLVVKNPSDQFVPARLGTSFQSATQAELSCPLSLSPRELQLCKRSKLFLTP